MNNTMIEVEGLQKSFGDVEAVAEISFRVKEGEVFGLLGPNGAGKTTAVQMLTTLLPMDGGRASVAGFDVGTQADLVRQSIGLAGQQAAVDENLTGRENLVMFARLYHLPSKVAATRADELLERFRLYEFAGRPAQTYSGGERRRLDVAASLVANPPVLFLDEPTTGLDPRSRSEVWDAISELASQGTTILLTTQYLEEADKLADQIVVIDRGRTVASGTPNELKDGLGRNVLEITVSSADDLDRAASVVSRASSKVATDLEKRALSIRLMTDDPTGLEVLRLLDGAGIALEEFQRRRPTLDEVFLAITDGPETQMGG